MAELPSSVLVVDDEPAVRRATQRVLTDAGFAVTTAEDGASALRALALNPAFDVIVTDLQMPRMGGIEFIRQVRKVNLDVPVIVLTGNPSLETAIAAVQYGAFRYLVKPAAAADLGKTVRDAAAMHRLAVLKRHAIELYESDGWLIGDRAGLESHFDVAMGNLWIAFQPIVMWPSTEVFGYEALVRSTDASLGSPGRLFEAADRLGRTQDLGRKIRTAIAAAVGALPDEGLVFVNLHPVELADPQLAGDKSPLAPFGPRLVLEITERSQLDRVDDLRGRIAALRELGCQIAVDDLGAGYAGLSSFSQLEPEIVKLDMSLIRGIDRSTRKASLVRSMISVCAKDLGTRVVCEGVETESERDALDALGADLLQGYLFGRPSRLESH